MAAHENNKPSANLPVTESHPQGVLLSIEQADPLKSILEELKTADQALRTIKKILQHSYVVDSIKIKQQNELFGKSMQEAFKIELSNSMRGKSEAERLVDRVIERIENSELQINKLYLQKP